MRGLAFTLGVLAIIASIVLVGLGVWNMQGAGHLEWARPDVKPTIMTFAYKVYGNRDVENGRFYLSKIRFKNSGNKDIRDFSISYQVPGYIDWTLPDLLPPIRPSQQFIEVFYPQFPKKVTEIKNKTASELDIKLHWHDGVQPHDEVIRQEFAFRGLNEIEYTDVPKEEVTGWFDMMVNLDLTAAMVTPNDPVVAEYAAAITEKLGGALAGAGGAKDVVEVMRGIYYYMIQNRNAIRRCAGNSSGSRRLSINGTNDPASSRCHHDKQWILHRADTALGVDSGTPGSRIVLCQRSGTCVHRRQERQ
jgi:hypothetical protein